MLALLAVAAAPASAAEVARVDGASLHAKDESHGLCVDLRSDPVDTTACGDPDRPYRALAMSVGGHVAGAAPAGAERIEAEMFDGRRVGAATLGPGRYAGRFAQRTRFFLFAARGRVVLVRLFDAAGTLIGAVEASPSRTLVLAGPEELIVERRIRVRGLRTQAFAPTPLASDRTEQRTCLRVRGPSSGGGLCALPHGPSLSLAVQEGCGPSRSVLYGVVAPSVTAVRVKLGSGRSLRVPVRTLFGEKRYVAAALPRGEAARWAEADGARQRLGARPGGLPCIRRSGSAVVSHPPARPRPAVPAEPPPAVAATLGTHRLLVRDADGDRLCSGIDRLRECLLPHVDPQLADVTHSDGLVAAVLPAEVAFVRLPGGELVPTVAGEGYEGRYAGRVRFLLAESARGRLAFLDAQGEEVGIARAGHPKPASGTVTLARGKRWRLRAGRYGRVACVGMSRHCELGLFGFPAAYAEVPCGTRRVLLWGAVPPRIRDVAAVVRGGRLLPARVVRVPRRVGRGRAFIVEVPRRMEVVALRLGSKRVRFPLPRASRQCGYAAFEPALAA